MLIIIFSIVSSIQEFLFGFPCIFTPVIRFFSIRYFPSFGFLTLDLSWLWSCFAWGLDKCMFRVWFVSLKEYSCLLCWNFTEFSVRVLLPGFLKFIHRVISSTPRWPIVAHRISWMGSMRVIPTKRLPGLWALVRRWFINFVRRVIEGAVRIKSVDLKLSVESSLGRSIVISPQKWRYHFPLFIPYVPKGSLRDVPDFID